VQQPRQAGQPGDLIPATGTARQVSDNGTAVRGTDCTQQVDTQLEANLPARFSAVHLPQARTAESGPDRTNNPRETVNPWGEGPLEPRWAAARRGPAELQIRRLVPKNCTAVSGTDSNNKLNHMQKTEQIPK
jgi:hypothetical protein